MSQRLRMVEASSHRGQGFALLRSGEVFRICQTCGERFPQTDEGWDKLKAHEFDHGEATHYDLRDLHGIHGEIGVVISLEEEPSWLYPKGRYALALYLRADDGTIYGLPGEVWNYKFDDDYRGPLRRAAQLRDLGTGAGPDA